MFFNFYYQLEHEGEVFNAMYQLKTENPKEALNLCKEIAISTGFPCRATNDAYGFEIMEYPE